MKRTTAAVVLQMPERRVRMVRRTAIRDTQSRLAGTDDLLIYDDDPQWITALSEQLRAVMVAAEDLAKDLGPRGVRVNLVAAGPIRSIAAKSIPGFEAFEEVWAQRAPLGWDVRNAEPVARAVVALLSDWFPATTGEIVHVDGGFHAMGA